MPPLPTPALLLPATELGGERVEPALPQRPVLVDPRAELPERLRPQRVQTPRPVGPDLDEPGLLQDPQVPRHPGLVDVHFRDEVVHRLLTFEQGPDDLKAAGIGQRLQYA